MPDGSVYKGLQPYFDYAKPLLDNIRPTNSTQRRAPHACRTRLEEGWLGMYVILLASRIRWKSSASSISVGRPGAGRIVERHGIDATYSQPRTCSPAILQATTTRPFSVTAEACAIPSRRFGLQSLSEAIPGGHLVNLARWKNADYDKIVDEVFSPRRTTRRR